MHVSTGSIAFVTTGDDRAPFPMGTLACDWERSMWGDPIVLAWEAIKIARGAMPNRITCPMCAVLFDMAIEQSML